MLSRNSENVFIEDIIYCPSQIYYYFRDQDERSWVAYVRQRGGPLTFELVEIREDGEWLWDWEGGMNKVRLSRVYDINGQPNEESEEKEIEALESEIMWYLRQRFPEVTFPIQPERRRGILVKEKKIKEITVKVVSFLLAPLDLYLLLQISLVGFSSQGNRKRGYYKNMQS